MVALVLGVGDGGVDVGGAVDGAVRREEDGLRVLPGLILQKEALYPAAGGIEAYGVQVAETVYDLDLRFQDRFFPGGIGGRHGQREGADHGRGAAQEGKIF